MDDGCTIKLTLDFQEIQIPPYSTSQRRCPECHHDKPMSVALEIQPFAFYLYINDNLLCLYQDLDVFFIRSKLTQKFDDFLSPVEKPSQAPMYYFKWYLNPRGCFNGIPEIWTKGHIFINTLLIFLFILKFLLSVFQQIFAAHLLCTMWRYKRATQAQFLSQGSLWFKHTINICFLNSNQMAPRKSSVLYTQHICLASLIIKKYCLTQSCSFLSYFLK